MKIETEKGIIIIKDVSEELILDNKGKRLNITMGENGFIARMGDTNHLMIDKDLNEIIAERARDMAVVFATKELWMQNPESAFTKGVPVALYNDVADRFDRWDKIKAVNDDLCEITVSSDVIPLFCENPTFTNMTIHSRSDTDFNAEVEMYFGKNEVIDKEKEFSIEDYLNQ